MSPWISVEDRLPQHEGEYLCMVKGCGIRIRKFIIWPSQNRQVWVSNGSETKKVTHWMPLPELPEELTDE